MFEPLHNSPANDILNFKPITLADKPEIQGLLGQIRPTIVEQSFNTLFPWQQPHAYHWARLADWLLIRTTYQGRTSFLPPLGPSQNYDQPLQALEAYADGLGLPLVFSEVTLPWRELILQERPGQFQMFSDRNAANYIYRIADLTNLSGKKYHAQKNMLNHFKRSYPEYQFRPLTTALLPACAEALERWCGERQNNCTNFPTLLQESLAIRCMFEHWSQLELFGACIFLQGQVQAFAIAEILNDDTVAVLIEKANSEIKGLYSAINQMFLAEYWQDFTYVNRAEDLGLANLRRTKLAYLPARLEMKYILYPSGWRNNRKGATHA